MIDSLNVDSLDLTTSLSSTLSVDSTEAVNTASKIIDFVNSTNVGIICLVVLVILCGCFAFRKIKL